MKSLFNNFLNWQSVVDLNAISDQIFNYIGTDTISDIQNSVLNSQDDLYGSVSSTVGEIELLTDTAMFDNHVNDSSILQNIANSARTSTLMDSKDEFAANVFSELENATAFNKTISTPDKEIFNNYEAQASVVSQSSNFATTANLNSLNQIDTPNSVLVSIIDYMDDVQEGNGGLFPIKLTDADGNPVSAVSDVTVNLSFSGSADNGADFNAVTTITIEKGSSGTYLPVQTIMDMIPEYRESVGISIESVSGGGFNQINVDTSQSYADMTISGKCHAGKPQLTISSVTVSEEGLYNGIADDLGDADTTDAVVASGEIKLTNVSANDIGNYNVKLVGPSDITVKGQPITWDWNSNDQILTGQTVIDGSVVDVMTVEVEDFANQSNGVVAQYSTTLLHSIDHPETDREDQLDINISAVLTNGAEEQTPVLMPITVEDDSPELASSTDNILLDQVNSNLTIVLDTSGSMNEPSVGEGLTLSRIDVAKQAIIELAENYSLVGDVRVNLITFNKTANNQGYWLTLDELRQAIDNMPAPVGGTNYDTALAESISSFSNPGALDNASNVSYFITDGKPTYGNGGEYVLTGPLEGNGVNGIGTKDEGTQPVEQMIWENFLNDNQVKSYAISIGPEITSKEHLDPIAYNGEVGADSDDLSIIVANSNDLAEVLVNTVPEPATGQLITTDKGFGADDGNILSFAIDGTTYTYNQAVNTITMEGDAPINSSYNPQTTTLTIQTEQGGELGLNLETGEYTYGTREFKDFYQENIVITLIDDDGDTKSAEQTLNIYRSGADIPDPEDPVTDEPDTSDAANAYVSITNLIGNVIEDENGLFPIELKDDQGNLIAANEDITVNLAYSGIAKNGEDYVDVASVVIAKGSSSADLVIETIDDKLAEGMELVSIKLDSVTGGGNQSVFVDTSANSVHMNIMDECAHDKATVSIIDNVGDIVEGDSATFPITVSDVPASNVTVSISYTGTATNGVDYIGSTSIVIPAGSTTADLDIQSLTDNLDEPLEDVVITLTDVSGGGFEAISIDQNNKVADVNIVDNNEPATLSVDSVTVNEDAGTATFTVTLAGSTPSSNVTVDYTTADDTAFAGSDYTATSGTLDFAPGETSKEITVSIVNDDVWETAETFDVILSNPLNAVVTQNGVGTIVNDDILAVDDSASVVEAVGANNGIDTATGNLLSNDYPNQQFSSISSIRIGDTEGVGVEGALGTVIVGSYGTLTVNADGSYVYKLDNNNATVDALNEGDSLIDSFNYSMTDNLLTDTAVLNINIAGKNDQIEPTISAVTVSEEGLSNQGAIADSDGNSDTTNDATARGSIEFLDLGSTDVSDLSIDLFGPTDVTVKGNEVTWSWDDATDVLTGQVDIDNNIIDVMTIAVEDIAKDGMNFSTNYETTLLHAIDHPINNEEDQIQLQFNAVISDGNNETTANLNVTVEDDSPAIAEGDLEIVSATTDANITLIFDTSGSMGKQVGNTGETRLDLAKSAVQKLVEGYAHAGDVKVQLITFAGDANMQAQWCTVDELMANLDSIVSGGATNYDAAINTAIQSYTSDGAIEGANNYAYFLTDGEPTLAYGTTSNFDSSVVNGNGYSLNIHPDLGIQADEESQWVDFLNQHNIKSYAFAFGSGVTDTDSLIPIAYDGQLGSNDDINLARSISDINQLDDILVDTIPQTITYDLINGDLSTGNTGFGADGGNVASITIDGTTYSYNGADGTMTTSGTQSNQFSFDVSTSTVMIHTQTDGLLALNFETGIYTYKTNPHIGTYEENIAFSVTDDDGDIVADEQTINIHNISANHDCIITNESSKTLLINQDVLLANDSTTPNSIIGFTFDDVGGTTEGVDPIVYTRNNGYGTNATIVNESNVSPNDHGNNDINSQLDDAIDLTNQSLFGKTADGTAPSSTANFIKFSGRINDTSNNQDTDLIKLDLSAGDELILDIDGGAGGYWNQSVDTVLRLYDANGTQLAVNDDSTFADAGSVARSYRNDTQDSSLNYSINEDSTYYVEISSYQGASYSKDTGSYNLWVGVENSNSQDSTNSFDYMLTDADASNSAHVSICYQNGDSVIGSDYSNTLIGRENQDDVIYGHGGNDIIQGKSGNDTLSGGTGDDIFIWTKNDIGSKGSPDADIITDLNQGDKIKLSTVLDDATLTDAVNNIDSYLNWNGDTDVLSFSSTGGYKDGFNASETDLTITINDFNGNLDNLMNDYII